MTDEPKPKIDMKEEEKKTKGIVKPKENVLVETPKSEEKKTKTEDARDVKPSKSEEQSKEDKSKKEEPKKPIQKKPIVKKTEAVVNARSLPISTKYSIAICRFIKNKKIEDAIFGLEQVIVKKKAVPMKGEIPHRKGKGMMSGRFPKKASEHFIKLLKSLLANANANEIENPRIVEAVANLAQRPYGRFGRTRKKRTHVKIKVKERKIVNKKEGKRK